MDMDEAQDMNDANNLTFNGEDLAHNSHNNLDGGITDNSIALHDFIRENVELQQNNSNIVNSFESTPIMSRSSRDKSEILEEITKELKYNLFNI